MNDEAIRQATAALMELPRRELEAAVVELLTAKARQLSPDEGLRLLFGVEAGIYPAEGQLSVAYGGGVHTKHRHIGYHDFFVRRIRAGERVLDAGCGKGEMAYDMAERAGATVVGIDIDGPSIDFARERHAHLRATYLREDVLAHRPDGHYDVLVLSNVLEHLPERPAFLRRLVRACTPDRVLLRLPLFEREWRVPLKRELGMEWRLDPTHETEYTLEAYEEEMRLAGLHVLHQEVRWGEIWAELAPTPGHAEGRDAS